MSMHKMMSSRTYMYPPPMTCILLLTRTMSMQKMMSTKRLKKKCASMSHLIVHGRMCEKGRKRMGGGGGGRGADKEESKEER
jgi:hypothetical protein